MTMTTMTMRMRMTMGGHQGTLAFALALGLWALARGDVRAAPPDVGEIGRILGYPGAELVVTDVTEQERFIYSVQTPSENNKDLAPPVDPARIRSAYRITGRTPESFLPILITIADEGTFLGPEVRGFLEQLAAVPRAELIKQNAGHLGAFAPEGGGEGGLIVGKLRRPSGFEETQAPGFAMATISEVTHPREGIDIRVAMQFGLDQGGNVDLVEMPGGERYSAFFRDHPGPLGAPAPDAPAFDWVEAFQGLNRVALEAHRAEQRAASVESRAGEGSDPPPGADSPAGPGASGGREADGGKAGAGSKGLLVAFAVAGALVLVLSVALVKRRLE